jgi:two-component system chemotaxis response regulator CheB
MPSRTIGPAQDWSSATESPEGGAPSVYSCPECGGVLWNTGPDDLPRFVCRVGHAYDPESLLAEEQMASEKQMWAALRSLEERASLARKLLIRARALGHSAAEKRFASHLADTERQAAPFRAALEPGGGSPRLVASSRDEA